METETERGSAVKPGESRRNVVVIHHALVQHKLGLMRRKDTSTSVAVVASDLPARIRNGTPSQRQESISKRTAANVSTLESGETSRIFR